MNEIIDFAIYLTGHDKETIEQMYNDWINNKPGYILTNSRNSMLNKKKHNV